MTKKLAACHGQIDWDNLQKQRGLDGKIHSEEVEAEAPRACEARAQREWAEASTSEEWIFPSNPSCF